MHLYKDKNQNQTLQKHTDSLNNRKNKVHFSPFSTLDNSSHALQMRKFQEMVNNSPQAMQMKAIQEIVNNSPQAMQMRRFQEMVNNSPQAIQMKAIQEMVNNSPQAIQMKAIQEMVNNSPQAMQMRRFQEMVNNSSSFQKKTNNDYTYPINVETSIQKKENKTGLPDTLKSGIEHLSGYSMEDVRVHYNSNKPAQLQAHAFAQGKDIHIASGEEKQLPHEAWHVVQQKQGRVKPTMQLQGKVNINDDVGLEKEADTMGAKALRGGTQTKPKKENPTGFQNFTFIQRDPILPNPITSIDDIITFLRAVKSEGTEVSIADQLSIQNFLKYVSLSLIRNEITMYRKLQYEVQYAEGGVIHNELFKSKKSKKPSKKRSRAVFSEPLGNIFTNQNSEDSDGEMDFDQEYKNHPELYQQAIDHSDANHVLNVINPRNTNMLTFLNRSILPSSINGQANNEAVPKSKTKLAEQLKKEEHLRGQQERVFFGSHLKQEEENKGQFDESIEVLKKRVRSGDLKAEDVEPLVTRSRRGFTIRDTEGHAEQSLLRSKAWDALKKRLIQQIQSSIGSEDLQKVEDRNSAVLVTLVLNRSSCRGCGLALSLALIEFWEELAVALGEKLDWKAMKQKYGSQVRFLIRFPTVYEYNKEKKSSFANLEDVLSSITSAGWEVMPIEPKIEGGMDSYNQLNESIKKIKKYPTKEDQKYYKSGGKKSPFQEPSRKKQKLIKAVDEKEVQPLDHMGTFLNLLNAVPRVEDEPIPNVDQQPEEQNFSNQYVGQVNNSLDLSGSNNSLDLSGSNDSLDWSGLNDLFDLSGSNKLSQLPQPVGFARHLFNIIRNDGGGECLFHALEGRNLNQEELNQVRNNVAAIRRGTPDTQDGMNYNAMAMAGGLGQIPEIGGEQADGLMRGRHAIPNNVYAAMQEIPGMYVGEDELVQWLQLQYNQGNDRTVAVVYHTGELATFTRNGRQLITNPQQNLANTIQNADITLYKTFNHWEQIQSLKQQDNN